MPGGSTPLRGNIIMSQLCAIALTPASVLANTTAEQTFTVPGLVLNDFVNIVKPSFQAGLALGNARVSAANTLAITYSNDTGSPITPTAETYLLMVDRPENVSAGTAGLPNGIY